MVVKVVPNRERKKKTQLREERISCAPKVNRCTMNILGVLNLFPGELSE